MKRQVVPTSPQYPDSSEQPNAHSFWSTMGVFILGILGGGLAGLGAASLVLTQYNFESQQIVVDASGSTAVTEVASVLSPNMRERSVSILNSQGELVGEALMVTADGLMVTAHAVQTGERLLNSKRQELIITLSTQDPLTGLYILQSQQTGLPVVTWATADEVSVGQRGFVMQLTPVQADWLTERTIASLHSVAHQAQSLQQFADRYQLDTTVPVVAGSPVVGLNGHVLGVLVDDHQLIPGHLIDQQLQYYIEHGTFRLLPVLSAISLFYSEVEGETGFLVTQSEVVGIQVGDVITAIDGQAVSKADQLLPLILRFSVGQTVQIDLKRGEQPLTASLNL